MKSLSKSNRTPLPGFQPLESADPAEVIEITIRVRGRREIDRVSLNSLTSAPLSQRRYLTREELENSYGAKAEDIAKVIEFARRNGLVVTESSAAARIVKVRGTIAAFQRAFSVELKSYTNRSGKSYRGRTGNVFVPDELAAVVQSVHGLDNREQARPHFRAVTSRPKVEQAIVLTPNQVAAAYSFPTNASGSGQTIALIELGGGYTTADLDTYFQQVSANPIVSAVSVDGGANQPIGDPNSVDTEVMLDIEVAGTIASAASIVVYFAPNTEQGFVDAVSYAIHDQNNNPSVVSISWGAPEKSWTQQALDAINLDLQEAALIGVTVLASTGDQGSSDGVADGSLNVDFPSSCPYVTACGGTSLELSGNGGIGSEIAWGGAANGGATGGGQSAYFPVPDYQTGLIIPSFTGRGTPDVAGDADPATCYNLLVDGTNGVVGGTSAVPPLYAGLVIGLNEILGTRVGFLNPFIYAHPQACSDVTQGSNGAYQAGPGWDATTGWGSIQGVTLLNALKAAPTPAPTSQTISATITLTISGGKVTGTVSGTLS